MMRILWATSHLPDPARGGGWAFEFELIRSLCAEHEVSVVCLLDSTCAVPEQLLALGVNVCTASWIPPGRPRTSLGLLWRVLRVPTGGALAHVPRAAAALGEAVARLEGRARYDVVVVYPGEMAEVAAGTTAPSALFLTDIHTRQREAELAHARTARQKLLWRAELMTMRRWERTWYPKADGLATVSTIDARSLHELTGCRADVVPLMIGDEWFAPATVDRVSDVVTFIGALDYRPNVDAVRWFAEAVWPRVSLACPHARFRVVGRVPVREVRDVVSAAGGELVADVADVRPYYWSTAVLVAPIRLGSGMRTKVLHAAATGAPLVSTSVALEGIEIEPGRHVSVADDAEGFADLVVAALGDPIGARARAVAAAEVARSYSSAAVRTRLEEFLVRTANGSPSGP